MCEEARALITAYLDALEDYDRIHLMFLAAYRRNDAEAMLGYRELLQDAKVKLANNRERFQEHQELHSCSEAINFGEF